MTTKTPTPTATTTTTTPTSLPGPETFHENAVDALNDDTLQGAIRHATGIIAARRGAAVARIPEWEGLRAHAERVKAHTLAHLDHYLCEFERNATAAGTVVHWARDGEEACRIVGEIAQSIDAKRVVKAKSMTSEEIHLNAYLDTLGLDTVETDLGEWIIQLAGETPSHIIAPAIHKTRRQIAELFRDKVGSDLTEDAVELTRTARDVLRRHFAEADLGVSGANFAVAETGSIHLLENEGNIRLTTSLPRVHVALMGIEKVVPRLADLATFWRLLPRSGTGQQLTTYQSVITGGAKPGSEGPEQVHIVIMDNRRTKMLANPDTRHSLACIRCGACLNACPVYQQIGGHAYGSVYPGPIGAVITPQLGSLKKAEQLPFASSLCSACRDVCPVKIDIPKMLLHLRSRVVEGEGVPAGERATRRPFLERMAFRMWSFGMRSPWRYRVGSRLARWTGWAWRRFPMVRRWNSVRELREPASKSFRDLWANEESRR